MIAIGLPMFVKLQLPWRKKIPLIAIFSLGFFVILAAILNKALQLDTSEHLKRKDKPVSYKTLNYYAFHSGEKRYHTFTIPKKTPGETREIKAPVPGLLRIQRLLLRCLTAAFTTCDQAAHGFVPKRSVLTNAKPHVGRRYVLNLDKKLCSEFREAS